MSHLRRVVREQAMLEMKRVLKPGSPVGYLSSGNQSSITEADIEAV